MAVKLWTVPFMRISVANLLLFLSQYVLFPALSLEMADRLGVSVGQTGVIFLFFTLGMFLIGPFHAYLIDAYKRKQVCMLSFALMLAATVGYAFVTNLTELILLSTVQGLAFGMASTAGITLAIDITISTLRSVSNVSFAWLARLGMIIGIALGTWICPVYGFKNLLAVSLVTGAAGILLVSGVYVPFRAPIVTKLYSFDRFLLLRGWVPAINMILIMFVPGVLVSLVHQSLNDFTLGTTGISIPFFAGVGVGFVLSLLLARWVQALFRHFSFKETPLRLVMMGIALEMLAFALLSAGASLVISSICLGLGLGLLMPEFLSMFVKLSQHCQRGTGNTTHLLSCEVGIALGIAASCCLDTDTILYAGHITAALALLFFILVTYPYYQKRKVR